MLHSEGFCVKLFASPSILSNVWLVLFVTLAGRIGCGFVGTSSVVRRNWRGLGGRRALGLINCVLSKSAVKSSDCAIVKCEGPVEGAGCEAETGTEEDAKGSSSVLKRGRRRREAGVEWALGTDEAGSRAASKRTLMARLFFLSLAVWSASR